MPLFNNNEDNAPLDDDSFWGPAMWLVKQNLAASHSDGAPCLLRSRNDAIELIFAAKDLGYCVWSEEFQGNHGRDWKPLEKAA
jgi:hypothetical protein